MAVESSWPEDPPRSRVSLADRLPGFVWDSIAPLVARARAYPGPVVDLSMGTPVDSVPEAARAALLRGADSPGYPHAAGTARVRAAAAAWLCRRWGVPDVDPESEVVPVSGTKEAITLLPLALGLRPGARVLCPEPGYPAYAVGAHAVGAIPEFSSTGTVADPQDVAMVWINTPANPTGEVLPPERLREIVDWARRHDVLVAVDECYLELGWDVRPVSVLHPSVCGESRRGVVALYSLSKSANMAGYRAGFVAGDPLVVSALRDGRKHLGMLVPTPVQAAMTAILGPHGDLAVEQQRSLYASRRRQLMEALRLAGFRIDYSAAGLYLWVTRGEPALETARRMAALGILVTPGDQYGPSGRQHVRISLTASDEDVACAVRRIASAAA